MLNSKLNSEALLLIFRFVFYSEIELWDGNWQLIENSKVNKSFEMC